MLISQKTAEDVSACACVLEYVVDDTFRLRAIRADGLSISEIEGDTIGSPSGLRCFAAFYQREKPCPSCPAREVIANGSAIEAAAGGLLAMPEHMACGRIAPADNQCAAVSLSAPEEIATNIRCYRLFIASPGGEKRIELFPREDGYMVGTEAGATIPVAGNMRKNPFMFHITVGQSWAVLENTGTTPARLTAPEPLQLPPGQSVVVGKEAFLECGTVRIRLQHQGSLVTRKTEIRIAPKPDADAAIAVIPAQPAEPETVSTPISAERKRFILDRLWPEFNAKMTAGELERQGLSPAEMRLKSQERLREILDMFPYPIADQISKDDLAAECIAEFVGLGPIEPLLRDPDITEIMVNGPDKIFIERRGKLTLSGTAFLSSEFLRRAIERIVTSKNRRIDERVPYADTRLDDGSRVHAIIPPLAIDYPILTIRKFPERHYGTEDLINFGSINREMAELIHLAVEHKQNVVVSGGTGTGKTTFLNICSRFIPEDERIITIEDSAELRLQKPHWLRLEARPANIEGEGAVPIRELVRNSLRMRPDRIVVGECRGAEAFDMLQAMNTGHEGSMTTLHANTCRDALGRMESMCLMAGLDLPISVVRAQISSAINIIAQLTRMVDGSRRCTMIAEITGMDNGVISMSPLVEFKQTGMDANKRVIGEFRFTGILPRFIQNLREAGHRVAENIYPKRNN